MRLWPNARLCFTLILGFLTLSLASGWAAVTASKTLPDGAQFTVDGGTLRIQFWSENIVRVTFAPAAALPALTSVSVEKGACATIPFTWDNARKTLSIGARHGEFPGMLKERTINVVVVGDKHGNGVATVDAPDEVVKYNGTAMKVKVGG